MEKSSSSNSTPTKITGVSTKIVDKLATSTSKMAYQKEPKIGTSSSKMGYQKEHTKIHSKYETFSPKMSYHKERESTTTNFKYNQKKTTNTFKDINTTTSSDASQNYWRSKILGSSGVSRDQDTENKITPISEVNPKMDDICIKTRCISIWHSHRRNEANEPYSMELVVQDQQNTRIQIYIAKELMYRFEHLFEEGHCYMISDFGITEASGRLPLIPHRFKIRFNKGTTVTHIEAFDENKYGFIMEPFSSLLDTENNHYYENDYVDIIGSVVGIGDIVPATSAGGNKVRRNIVIEDPYGDRLDMTFWDTWATMWDEYVKNNEATEHLVIILQLVKVKYWDGTPRIHNALFGSKIYVNQNIPEILAFKQSVEASDDYDEEKMQNRLLKTEERMLTINNFFKGAKIKTVGTIRDSDPETHYIVYATIHKIHKEHRWAYPGCKKCNKRIEVLPRQNCEPVYLCHEHGNVQPSPWFKVILRVIDDTGSAPVLFFNNNFEKLSGYTTWQLLEKYEMNPDEYFPEELDEIVGKKYLFKIFYSKYNEPSNTHNYRCDAFTDDDDLIKHYKTKYLDTNFEYEDTIQDLEEQIILEKNNSDDDNSDVSEQDYSNETNTTKWNVGNKEEINQKCEKRKQALPWMLKKQRR